MADATAPHDVVEAQDELARLEGLRHVVVYTSLEAFDAVLGLRARGEHADRDGRHALEVTREVEPAFARHHEIEDHEVEGEATHGGACGFGIPRRRHAEAAILEIAAEQLPNALVVVDEQHVGRVVRQRIPAGETACERHG